MQSTETSTIFFFFSFLIFFEMISSIVCVGNSHGNLFLLLTIRNFIVFPPQST